jgi:hypothetical protein
MPTWASVLVLVAIVALIGYGMWHGWRRRARVTGEGVPALPAVPDDLGAVRIGPLEATYVSSTTHGDWLDRVTAHHLGSRSAAEVEVHEKGVLLRRHGAIDVFVPAAALRSVGAAPGMAGKFVGGEGLVVLTWAPAAGRALDTGLLVRHRAERPLLIEAVQSLIPKEAAA